MGKYFSHFSEKDTQNILIRVIRSFGIEISLAQVKQIIIVDLDYNAYLSNPVEKKFLVLDNLINLWLIFLFIEILQ